MSSRQVKDIRLLSQTIFFFPQENLWQQFWVNVVTFYTHRTQRRRLHVAKAEIPQSPTRVMCALYAMELCSSSRQGVAFTSPLWESRMACGRFCRTRVHFSTLRIQTGLWKVLSDKNEGEVQLLALGQGSMMLFVLKSWWTILWTSWGFPAGSSARHPSWDQPEPPPSSDWQIN